MSSRSAVCATKVLPSWLEDAICVYEFKQRPVPTTPTKIEKILTALGQYAEGSDQLMTLIDGLQEDVHARYLRWKFNAKDVMIFSIETKTDISPENLKLLHACGYQLVKSDIYFPKAKSATKYDHDEEKDGSEEE